MKKLLLLSFILFFLAFHNVSLAQTPLEDSVITSIVNKVNVDSVRNVIQSLQNFQTRFLKAPNRFAIADWIKQRFISYGFTDVVLDSFMCTTQLGGLSTTLQVNVVATLPGSDFPDQIYIIGAHYDSYASGNPLTNAPGADDNASGTAAVLETARTIMASGFQPRATLRFIAFAAEEGMLSGNSGCEYYATTAFNTGMNIKLMINADMISYTSKPLAQSAVSINYYTGHTNLLTLAKEVTAQFTSITAVNGSLNQYSDSYPFYEKGYPAVYFEEDNFSPFYHTVNDVISNYNMAFCSEVIKGAGATLLKKIMLDHPLPVELILFEGVSLSGGIQLNWVTASEVNNFGFEIERAVSDFEWVTIGFVPGNGTTTEQKHYSFSDNYFNPQAAIYYRLKQVDYDGSYEYSDIVNVAAAPKEFILLSNYPNPFNPVTIIKYSINESANTSLIVYDLLGREVAVLVNGAVTPGEYRVEFDAKAYNLGSGIYLCRLRSGSFVQTNKMILMR